MATASPKKVDECPRPLQVSKSFSRIEATSPSNGKRSRASTLNGTIPENLVAENATTIENIKPGSGSDLFETNYEDACAKADASEEKTEKLPSDFDELPLELVSLTDAFVDSLSAKVHPTPPSADSLSILFQDFYVLAATHLNTHISILSSRQHRQNSPAPSIASKSSANSRTRPKSSSIGSKDRPRILPQQSESEQQMLTSEEISERKRARKLLEHKRIALEEAVERRVCEKSYDRIWRHRSTQDEAQDEKLRSKTAALSVVGIGLSELGIDLGDDTTDSDVEDKEAEVREWLAGARQELLLMNNEKSPLGKLKHLKAAHKCIVDTLGHFHPSSSADEIMPMLIYSLITSPPEGINVISNLYYIQRFRSESKIDGEAAYCLTNLEAAITFLETVDLASLRAEETLSGPPKLTSGPSTPRRHDANFLTPQPVTEPSLSPAALSPLTPSFKLPKATPSPSLRPLYQVPNRRLSELFQPPAQAIGAAADGVLNTADQGFKNIGNSLGESYKFLLGKLKERQESISGSSDRSITALPKTLEDARKLIGTPPPDDELASGSSSLHTQETSTSTTASDKSTPKTEDKLLGMIGGRSTNSPRDRSVDSSRSAGSAKKVAFAAAEEKSSSPLGGISPNPALAEGMRILGNINPMNKLAGFGVMRGFGRSASTAPTPVPIKTANAVPDGGIADLTTAFPDLAPVLPPKEKEIPKIAPPIKRFMEVHSPGDLRLNEVLELLKDYRRLAGALKDLGAV